MRYREAIGSAMVFVVALAASDAFGASARPTDVTVDQARAMIQQRARSAEFIILDVRTPDEFSGGHVAGAVNVNVLAADFEARIGTLDRGKSYLVYCRTGNRSSQAVQVMERLGFRSLYHMFEGIVSWQQKGFPLSKSS